MGSTEAAPDTIRRAHAVHPIAALQTEYSLWSREPEDELLDLCAELGITFVAYKERGCTPAQLALAWLLDHDDVVPIPGTRRIERLEENLAGADIRLTAEERARLEDAVPAGAAAGERYPEGAMRTANR